MKPAKTLIARQSGKRGDMLNCLWRNYCRPVKATDTKMLGIAYEDFKKGDRVRIIKSIDDRYDALAYPI